MARTLGDAFVRIRPDMSGFGPQVASGVTSSERGVKSRLGGFAKTAGLVVGAGLAAGVASFTRNGVQLEAQFGKTMSVLQATTKAPQAEMRQLSALAMKMGADTAFSANDASKAMLELARGGMTAAQIRGGALAGTMTLAAAGELDMGTAANMTVKAMGQFNLSARDSSAVAAALAGAANASSASVGDMGFALGQAGLAANSVGFSLQETTGILAAFSNNGLEGSDAGTSLKTMLDRLQPSTKSAEAAMRGLGVITEDGRNKFLKANGEFQSAARISEVLRQGTEGLSAAESKRLITQAFGSDAQRAATILAKEGAAGINEMTKATSDQAAAQNMAQANMRGTAGSLEMMRGSIETAQLAWGRAIKPLTIFGATLVTHIANGAVPIIEDFGRISARELGKVDFTVVSDALKRVDLGAIFGSIKAAVSGIDWRGVGASIGGIGASIEGVDWSRLGQAFGQGTTDTISVFSVVIGFAADHVDELAAALPFLITAFIAYKAAQATSNVVALAHLPLMAAQVVANFALAGANRSLATQMMISNGVERVGMITRIRSTVATTAAAVVSGVARAAVLAWTGAQWLLNAALTANPIGLVVLAVVGLIAILVLAWRRSDTFKRIVSAAFDKVKDAAAAAWGWLKKNWPLLLAIITGPIGLATLFVVRHWESIKDKFRTVKDWVLGTFRRAWGGLRDVLAGPVRFARDTIQNIFGAGGPVRTAFGNAVTGIRRIWSNLRDAVRAPIGFIVNTVFNKGIVPFVNRIPFIPGTLRTIGGFDTGGYTGAGARKTPAGVVHKGEFVHDQETTRNARPLLDLLHRTKGRVQNLWLGGGVKPAAGAESQHSGYPWARWSGDINEPGSSDIGHPVRAWKSGVVASVRHMLTSYGNHIRINHANNERTLYAHLSRVLVNVGQAVRGGQTIGLKGGTGNVTGPHLHFEISGGTNPIQGVMRGSKATGAVSGYTGPSAEEAGRSLNPARWVAALGRMGPWGGAFGDMVGGVVGRLRDTVVSKVKDAAEAVFMPAGAGVGAAGLGGRYQSIVKNLAARQYGWTGAQWTALRALVQGESGWNPNAQNPSSSAYGLFQFLDSTWAGVGARKTGQPLGQSIAGLRYIKQSYGTPLRAYQLWSQRSPHWYDDGGEARGTGVMQKRVIAAERVLSPRQTDLHNRQTVALEKLAASNGGGGQRVGIVITNWRDGTGYMVELAEGTVQARRAHDAQINRQYRRST